MKNLFLFLVLVNFSFINSTQVEWQISLSPEFDYIAPDFEGKSENLSQFESVLENAVLLMGDHCFLRYRLMSNEKWIQQCCFNPKVNHSLEYYEKPASISDEEWKKASPYLIPFNHPYKDSLDALFSKRIIATKRALQNAGFNLNKRKINNRPYVGNHPLFKGYIFKIYTEDQPESNTTDRLIHRIEGANLVREFLQANHYQNELKVPRKWLYLVPENNHFGGFEKRHFLIIEDDMEIFREKENFRLWKKNCNTKQLEALFHTLTSLGLSDSVYAWNIPISADGRIAFIDLEEYLNWPIRIEDTKEFLNKSMGEFWDLLIQSKANSG